tara:strand:+ start:343293 stop:345599 length:2307 start_codon:yes stop_codon:yes gene_type:complete
LRIAVGDLARFCHRRGDIDHRFNPSPSAEQGIAGHQRIYTRRPASYCSEHAVEYCHEEPGLALELRGRADGYDPAQRLLEEIKTCRVHPASIPEAVSDSHMAQARLYAALVAAQENHAQITVRLTWLNIDSDEEHSRDEVLSAAELSAFLALTLRRFSTWLHLLARLRQQRDASLKSLSFPYGEFRGGQRQLAELTYKCIDQAGQLLLEAPTGIGKTAAVLYPALKALPLSKHDRLVFVTAKTIGRRAAQDTLQRFRDAGYRGTALSLTAKDSICLSPGRACHADDCPYAKSYYDKLPAAMDAAMNTPALRQQELEEIARQYEVCPYQLSLDLLPWVDVVIADQHYLYSLTAVLATAMAAGEERWSVLLDEAHNLPDRARSMYSASLEKMALMAAREEADKAMLRPLNRINRQMLELQKSSWQESEFDTRSDAPEALQQALQDWSADVSARLAEEPRYLQQRPALMAFFFDALQFLRVAQHWGDDYRFEMTRGSARQSLRLTLNCLDPARLLRERHALAHSLTAFSATLSPLDWARGRLGLPEEAVCVQAQSPFAAQQLQVSLATDIDTRFHQREASLGRLAQTLGEWLAAHSGNCIIYFPSYRYLQDCLGRMESDARLPLSRCVWSQQLQQGAVAREALLELLHERTDVAAFCILGGVFGEGVDLPGEQLDSVVIVGVGMPQVNRDTQQLRAWYQRRNGAGFEYAFLYPGMQKVDQALGRVVRRMEDCGHALLIDPRYADSQYRALLPRWWQYHSYAQPQPDQSGSL